ncbi:MAG: DUF2268 domain-containing protein [Gemmatimonadota bacterium]|nr:DUF2268 domain-containing protein [Gemmatimonadota bacterium]MDH3366209.1 DUF2268 domain-containing protein [Gemmatimonadota bacterium]MDH3476966.1 DUF2268 domain-containing protein [Gemmatimonadota bacterium]MDH3568968.1 DUF2268 domain-containing protein [Gemmatimonadota bacterium]MDH5549180.1 DUF2268 domain-containing protein [Gemmatimonadota bacterium]
MLINLVPEFFRVVEAPDPLEAYRRYLDDHLPVLSSYWHNYILDLASPHVDDVIGRALAADRRDLHDVLDRLDVPALAEDVMRRCEDLFEVDVPFDVYLMVGVGGANAGELVVGGRGIAFVCLEHFTGRPNHESLGLGLQPELIGPWIAHEVAHAVRYTAPESRSTLARVIRELRGTYDLWEAGSRATLRELLVNEGLAVAASRAVAPGFDSWDYLGYTRRQYRRLRQLEAFLARVTEFDLDRQGLGYRLRYLTGGVSAAQRLVGGKVIPERSGYYLGARMVEAIVAESGIARALRADAVECRESEERARGIHTA